MFGELAHDGSESFTKLSPEVGSTNKHSKQLMYYVNSPVVSRLPAFFPFLGVPAMPSQLPPSAPLLLLAATHDDTPPYKEGGEIHVRDLEDLL